MTRFISKASMEMSEAARNAPVDHRCSAHGCPLPGSISSSIGANGTFYCRFHFGADPKDWPKITEDVKRLKIQAERELKDEARIAHEWCLAKGLDTPEKVKAFAMSFINKPMKGVAA
jgi:hypothetical protein